MSDNPELTNVVKKSLEQRGVLDQLKARIRAEVYSAIEHPEECRQIVGKENILINELIREYLEFNKYKYSLSVFTAESCMSKDHLNRDFLSSELNIVEDISSRSIPLLYSLVYHHSQSSLLPSNQLKLSTSARELNDNKNFNDSGIFRRVSNVWSTAER